MEQYILKSALVEKIEKLREIAYKLYGYSQFDTAYNSVLDVIDTLEVKEWDNVWHDASETPKGAGDKEILVQFTDYHTSVHEIDDWEYLDHQTKWAYLKDLI